MFYLELGAYAFYYNERVAAHADYSYLGIIPAGGVRWDFNLTKSWTVFGAVKAGLALGTGDAPHRFWFVPAFSVGGFGTSHAACSYGSRLAIRGSYRPASASSCRGHGRANAFSSAQSSIMRCTHAVALDATVRSAGSSMGRLSTN